MKAVSTPADTGDAMAETLRWEREQGLFDFRWGGVPAWRLVRKSLIVGHLAEQDARGRSNYNERSLGQALRMVGNAIRSLPQLARLRRRHFLFVCFPRRRLEGSVWVDPFADPLSELLGDEVSFCVEKPFAGRHYRPARTPGLLYLDGVQLFASAAGRIARWLAPLAARALAPLSAPVAARFGAPEARILRLVAGAVAEFRVEAAAMSVLLAIIRPRCVLLTSRWVHAPLIRSAKRRGIRVLELQHGAPVHGGHAYATPYDRELDPDAMLTFGPYWNRFDWGIAADAVTAIGHRYAWMRRARRSATAPQARRVMLVSRPSRNAYLSERFLDLVQRHPGREFVLRLHPQDVHRWETRYPAGRLPNVRVSTEAEEDLYAAFSGCTVAVGDDSTVLYEAAFFGLNVAILNLDGRNRCPALAFSGQFGFAEARTAEALDALLDAPARTAATEGNPFLAEFDDARFRALVD